MMLFTMASSSKSQFFLFSILILVTILGSNAQNKKPNAFHIPITVDTKTRHYYATLQIGTPPNDFNKAAIDLGGSLLSLACDKYKPSTHRFVPCNSTKCQDIKSQPCLSRDLCGLTSVNPFTNTMLFGSLSSDVVTLHETDGTAALTKTYSTNLDILCVNLRDLSGLPNDTNAILGLGRTQISLTSRLSSAFNIVPKLGLCLPSSNEYGFGDIFIGGGPYRFPGGEDASNWLNYTPLVSEWESDEYFVSVKSIKVDKRVAHLDSPLVISFHAKITTRFPYGVLQSTVYKALVNAFAKSAAARNITRVAPVNPFEACFSTKNVHWTKAGPRVPVIDLELPGRMGSVNWRIHGANSMVRVNKNTLCLGFIDGGLKARTAIVLGGLQLEDNFLLFDLSTSTLGFSSSLLPRSATCSHFRNF